MRRKNVSNIGLRKWANYECRSPKNNLRRKNVSNSKNVSIIGVGLIGGSLGKALKKRGAVWGGRIKITGVGRHPDKLRFAKRTGAIDGWTTDFAEGVRDADIVVLCVPVDRIVEIAKRILPHVKRSCVITDAGSVKGAIIRQVEKMPSLSGVFVGSHPIAGSEKTGVSFADAGLFNGATVVITPTRRVNGKSLKEIAGMWKAAGAKTLIMPAAMHDRYLALTSHLPHILSGALVNLVWNLYNKNKDAGRLLAGSFRDLTRVSDSDPALWSAICRLNAKEVFGAVAGYIRILKKIQQYRSMKELNRFFSFAKNKRCQLLVSGQKKRLKQP
ncbi:MAG: prephenate dehydrogenase/arogenate dehydrogenase family protein [Elusimicrobiota bacterium]